MACAAVLWGADSRADLPALRPAIILEEPAGLLATCVAGPAVTD
jgi:hypothetical protein